MRHSLLLHARIAFAALGATCCAPLIVIVGLSLPPNASAQSPPISRNAARAGVRPGANVTVNLRDGSRLYGRLERLDDDSVVVAGAAGRIAFARATVASVRDAGTAHSRGNGSIEYWFRTPNSTRLVFGPTGRTLAQGEGYFADHDILVGSLAVGLTDRITIGGGGLLVPNSQLWFVTPKVGLVRGEDFNLAVGALVGGWGSSGTAGIGYAVGTIGGPDRSLTLGVGNGFTGTTATRDVVFIAGGEIRAARRFSFLTENYLTTATSDALLSYGVRFLGEKLTFDLAFFNLARDPMFPGIPFVGASVKF